ncbi:MAG: YaeQ family protein [Povalibacter sp.]
MALSATVFVFDIQLADADRNVYESLSLRVARHPSESNEYLLTRVLAYCLEYTEGVSFSSGGLSNPDEPAITVRDLTGALQAWIEIGSPDAARLHKAGKAAQRVAVYPHKQAHLLLAKLEGERIHRAAALAICAIDPEFILALSERLSKRMQFDLSVSEGHLYVSVGAETLSGTIETHRLNQQ